GSRHWFPNDWHNAQRHAHGGYFADYHMLCTGEYCPFGPKIRGLTEIDSRIDQVLFVNTSNERQGRMGCCSSVAWKCPTSAMRHSYKEGRHRIKSQRRQGNRLTKEVNKCN
ncbi:unnamed protein product, partial [Adineta ricciae]